MVSQYEDGPNLPTLEDLAEHATPTPWTLKPIDGSPQVDILGKQGFLTVSPAVTHSLADAELIVRAVNAFEPLVEALEMAAGELRNHALFGDVGAEEARNKIFAALAKARGEQ
jgi:hypothetical protein